MIFATRRLIRLVGWLLTPFAAWAVAFLGAWVGANIGSIVASPGWAFVMLILGAVLGGFSGAAAWIWGLRRAWLCALRHKRERLAKQRAAAREVIGDGDHGSRVNGG